MHGLRRRCRGRSHTITSGIAVFAIVGATISGCGSSTNAARTTAPSDAATARSAGCDSAAAPGTARPVTSTVRLEIDGESRWARQHLPLAPAPTVAKPVVIDLHGFDQGPTLEVSRTRFEELGRSEGFITVTPAGTGTPIHWDPRLDSADMTFIGKLLDRVEQTDCVDEDRVFVTGFSNGAFMASSVACRFAPRVAAVAPVAGLRAVPGCRPARAVPVITFHGTGDTFVPYDGGFGIHTKDLPDPDDPSRTLGELAPDRIPIAAPGTIAQSVPDALRAWAVRDGCRATPVKKEVNPDVQHVSYPCPAGVAVELYRIEGGEHLWPGSKDSIEFDAARDHSGRTLDATKLIWDFFSTHPRR